jgi:hypothetical protein
MFRPTRDGNSGVEESDAVGDLMPMSPPFANGLMPPMPPPMPPPPPKTAEMEIWRHKIAAEHCPDDVTTKGL